MTKLEKKLIELGYEKTNYCFYFKKDIRIYITWKAHQILKDKCCVVIERRKIKNRNDIQVLKDSIENYDNQLRILWNDLEALKKYEEKI